MSREQALKQSLSAIQNYLTTLEKSGQISNLSLTFEFSKDVDVESNFTTTFQELFSTLSNIKEENDVLKTARTNLGNTITSPKAYCDQPEPKLVQICISRKEMNRRIEAFIKRKRKEVDVLNVQEFCGRTAFEEDNPDYENVNTCARVDAIYFPRYSNQSHVKLSRVDNKWGPQTRPKNSAQCKPSDNPNSFTKQLTNNGIEERIRNMESHLKLKSGELNEDIFSRIKVLEDKILFLEGISPDYFGTSLTKMVSSKGKHKIEFESKYQDWSLTDIDHRLQQLAETIKERNHKEPQTV